MEAGKRTINDIFNGNKVLEIPFFQRAYVWDTKQWERFLSDMEQVSQINKPYFLGSVILKQQLTDSQQSVGDRRTVIDGQQRLTTLTIFFKVLSLRLGNQSLSRLFRLHMKNDEIALLHNHNDVSAFNSILNLTEEITVEGDDNITNAYRYFSEHIDPEKLDFNNILVNVMFVGIDLGANEDEQQIFDTINSLGVKLTTAEMLKNHLFGRNELELYNNYWKDVFEKDAETKDFWDIEVIGGRNLIDLFFYSLLQIKIHDVELKVSTEDKTEFSKLEGLFESYKSCIKKYGLEKGTLIAEIREYAVLFQENFDPEIITEHLSGSDRIDRINAIIFGLDTTTLIPYVLFVLKNVPDANEQSRIFEYLETYVMRRMVCHASTKNYSQLFSEQLIANKLTTLTELRDYINQRSDKVNYLPSDDELRMGFHESKLVNKQARGILYFIESKIRNNAKHSTSLLGMNSYTLEHVMPKKWESDWDYPEGEFDEEIRNRKLLTLGNLTILSSSLNTAVRNSSWSVKKSGQGTRLGLNHFATGLDTFSQYLNESIWDEDLIQKRADFLYEAGRGIWPN